jgi:NADH-quinone oxidoreductase subunit L
LGHWLLTLFPSSDFSLIAALLGLPLLGAFVNGVWGKRLGNDAVRMLALSMIGLSFLVSVLAFAALIAHVDANEHSHVRLSWTAWNWMHTNGGGGAQTAMSHIPIDVRFSIDALSGVMMLIVTGVGFLIHLYATSYMADDPGYARFFAYMNLFIFAMLVLILGDNLPVLFVGWEGVGLCSYLLIGFWYEKMPNAAAGKKAFLANRVGDFGLICGMFLLAHYTNALDWAGISGGGQALVAVDDRVHVWPIGGGEYQGVFAFLQPGFFQAHHTPILQSITPAHPVTISAATAVGLALLLGCTGKSAQIPLYVWLPDAMAGPTPVSALIHAATMVTAGIYLICRLSFVFVLSPGVMMIIAIVGAATALLAATIALVQNDIKKVLAYSTISQLGFMFLGVGVGAFTAGFFHVFTHAFFKACLFLCAGSVIHAMHARIHDDDKAQDMRNMGGLRKYMPYTFWTFIAATAAIIGVPFTSGFFSKDEILYKAFVDHTVSPFAEILKAEHAPPFEVPMWIGPALYGVGVLAATLTAFYMCRAAFMTFFGDFRGWTIGRPSLLAKSELGAAGHDVHAHPDLSTPGYPPHESPWQMTVPLIILGTCSIVVGLVFNAGPIPSEALHSLDHWLAPVFQDAVRDAVKVPVERSEVWLMFGGIGAFAVGSYAAYRMYIVEKGAPAKRLAQAMPRLYGLVLDKWRVDELYDATILNAVDALGDTSAAIDESVVDGIVSKLPAILASVLGSILRAFQNGVVHVYATMMVIGLVAFGWFFIAPHADLTVDASAGESSGDYVVSAGPGMGYHYRWDTGDDKAEAKPPGPGPGKGFSEQSSLKIHLDPDKSQTVSVEVTNAFDLHSSRSIQLKRPSGPVQPPQGGQPGQPVHGGMPAVQRGAE